MMQLTIQPVTHDNFRAIIALAVGPGQEDYIEPNSQSLAEVLYDPQYDWQPFGLYADGAPVGFAMVGDYDADQQNIWLDRFMIDAAAQGQHYGSGLLDALLAYICQRWQVRTVTLSYHDENQFAARFYARHGFADTGRWDPSNGEHILLWTAPKSSVVLR